MRPGQSVEVVFRRAENVDAVVMEAAPNQNRLRVRLELQPGATPDAGPVAKALRHQLAAAGLADAVPFEVEFVPRLEPDPTTGKLRRIVTRVGPPADLAQTVGGRVPALV